MKLAAVERSVGVVISLFPALSCTQWQNGFTVVEQPPKFEKSRERGCFQAAQVASGSLVAKALESM
jgi:hypothetical protein